MRQLKTDYIMSPQQLVSCDTSDYGCSGGWPTTAYDVSDLAIYTLDLVLGTPSYAAIIAIPMGSTWKMLEVS